MPYTLLARRAVDPDSAARVDEVLRAMRTAGVIDAGEFER